MAYFNKEYVAKEIFPRELGRKLGTLKQLREKSDYDDFYIASKAQAEEQYNTAKYTLEQVSQYLNKNNTDESKERLWNDEEEVWCVPLLFLYN